MTCGCGIPYLELPMWAVIRNNHDPHGNFTGESVHMFRGCTVCRDTFCSCGKTHPVPQGRKVTHV
jgi:hypothetical protein